MTLLDDVLELRIRDHGGRRWANIAGQEPVFSVGL
jgi:hypothetical protein